MTGSTILLVDHDPEALSLLAGQLKGTGCAITFANDAASAVAMARRIHPDLVVLALGLPGGDGLVVMERLRMLAETATVPIIVLSGSDPSEYESAATRFGVEACLRKPADSEMLLGAIRHALTETTAVLDGVRRQRMAAATAVGAFVRR